MWIALTDHAGMKQGLHRFVSLCVTCTDNDWTQPIGRRESIKVKVCGK